MLMVFYKYTLRTMQNRAIKAFISMNYRPLAPLLRLVESVHPGHRPGPRKRARPKLARSFRVANGGSCALIRVKNLMLCQ